MRNRNYNFAFAHTIFSLDILPSPYFCLSNLTPTVKPSFAWPHEKNRVISLAPNLTRAANLWFRNSNAFRKQAGNLETETVFLRRLKGASPPDTKCSTSTLAT